MIILLGLSYQIAVATSSTDKTLLKIQTAIRIDDFPSFVNSKAKYETKAGTVNGIEWRIVVELRKYCRKSKRYITLNSSSPGSAEILNIYCVNAPAPFCSLFYLDAVLKFKRTRFSKKFTLYRPTISSRNQNEDCKQGFETKLEVFPFH